MNLKLRLSLLVGVITLFVNTISAQEVVINSELQKDTILIGEQLEMKITTQVLKEDKIIFPEFKDTISKNIEVISAYDPVIKQDAGFGIYEKRYVITSFDTGSHVIPSLNIALINGNDTSFYSSNPIQLYVKPFILLDTIPIDTVSAQNPGFILRGHDGFKKEIEKYIPDSLKRTLTADTLQMVNEYIKQEIVKSFSAEITKNTSLYEQEEILKIIESPEHSLYIVDKGGIIEEYVVPGSTDTLFVDEFASVQAGQPLFTVYRIKDINENLYNTKFNFAELWNIIKNLFIKYWWIILLGLMIIGALVYFMVFYKKDKKPVIFRVKPKEPAHIIALTKLEKIKNEKIWSAGLIKEYFVQLTDVLREYIENRYGIYAREMTTTEILEAFDRTLYLDQYGRGILEQVLLIADSVKFAKYKPLQDEITMSLNNSFLFVENTKEIISDNSKLKQEQAEIEINENVEPLSEKKE